VPNCLAEFVRKNSTKASSRLRPR